MDSAETPECTQPSKRFCKASNGSGLENTSPNSDSAYFKSYEDIGIHEDMIKDTVRTNSYRLAILRASERLAGKVVADVGAGTGILSCFCVQAGARKVYAIEASAMAEQAKKVVAANNAVGKIEVIQGRVEDIELPEKVDAIVSEWMGHFLLYESMLNSVIDARNRWLKKDGILLPNKATLYLAPFVNDTIYTEKIEFWKGVKEKYGVDLSCLEPHARKTVCGQLHIEDVQGADLLARGCKLTDLDLQTVTLDDLDSIKAPFSFTCYGRELLCGFTSWFTVTFDTEVDGKEAVTISTAPGKHPTHWRQCTMYLEDPIDVEQDTVITGHIVLTPGKENKRFLNVDLTFQVADGAPVTRHYSMTDGSS